MKLFSNFVSSPQREAGVTCPVELADWKRPFLVRGDWLVVTSDHSSPHSALRKLHRALRPSFSDHKGAHCGGGPEACA